MKQNVNIVVKHKANIANKHEVFIVDKHNVCIIFHLLDKLRNMYMLIGVYDLL